MAKKDRQWQRWGLPDGRAAAKKSAAAESVVETCPACTSSVDPKAAACARCGAGLDYYRKQNEEAKRKESASEHPAQ